ncbi:copper amine oxidase N-terminal domain-containing protein [Peptoniphilus catoniae]|uniref:copper amine oxidase N-terminal domain-containing protein n=1 Tax=Peptoniphilus catoniae TaxID=1660341 RepID=UPI0010FEA514|nr:copper amine oxidase N-terminal domain-containing protein [Peptoniphilus catoniae]
MKKFLIFTLALVMALEVSVFAERSISISLNGKEIKTDAPAYIKDDRTLVPIRFISEALGYKVDWNEKDRQVTISKEGIEMVLTIGKKEVLINGVSKSNDVAPEITKDRTFVPIRFIAENFGIKVDWDKDNYVVILTSKEDSLKDPYAKELKNIASDFQKSLEDLRTYYFEDVSKYNNDQILSKLNEIKDKVRSLAKNLDQMEARDQYKISYKLLKEAIVLGDNIIDNYNQALLAGDKDIAKRVVDLHTQLAIKISEFKSALDAESKGLPYREDKDIKSYNDAGEKGNLLNDPTLKNLFNQL